MSTKELLAQARKAVSGINEKPYSAVTDWIERLCSEKYAVEEYDGLIELIESIKLQPTGPTEASRAIRKKLKYGNTHRQLRALTVRRTNSAILLSHNRQILKALVENCGTRFQTTFANERLVDRIKIMAGDPMTDEAVKKKLYAVLLSWQHQFKDDRSMQLVAGLYGQLRGTRPGAAEAYRKEQDRLQEESKVRQSKREAEMREKEEDKRRAREEKERAKQKKGAQVKRAPFDFQKEKPNIMAAVGVGSQSAHSLVNALQHVNREKDSVVDNEVVQDYLNKVKLARRQIVRYIQLVETDATGEYIGTLLSTNETIIAALQLYDYYTKAPEHDSDDEPAATSSAASGTEPVEKGLASLELGEVDKLQIRQRRAVERHASYSSLPRPSTSSAHADLADLDFSNSALQAPLQPSRADHEEFDRGNLSDYSDYDSSEDETSHTQRAGTSATSPYATSRPYERNGTGLLDADDDEADPFADPDPDEGVSTPGITERPRMNWAAI